MLYQLSNHQKYISNIIEQNKKYSFQFLSLADNNSTRMRRFVAALISCLFKPYLRIVE